MADKRRPDRGRRGPPRRGQGTPVPHAGRRDRRDAASQPRATRAPVELPRDVLDELRATARPGKADIAAKVFGEAAAAFADEDYAEAARLADQVKHMALRAASARELLGLAYYRSGRWQDAARELGAFRRITGTTEQNPVIADCYRALGRPERALELCDEMGPRTTSAPVYFEGQIVAAGALSDLGRIDDAIARLERLSLRPEVAAEHHLRAWYVLADLLARKGRFTQAREWFEAVAAADPDLTDAAERATRIGR